MNKLELAQRGTDVRALKQQASTAVADINKQIENLMRERAAQEHEVFVNDVKEKALRAAIRVFEDHGLA